MKALAYAFSAENPHALRNILLVAVTVAYLAVIVVLFLRHTQQTEVRKAIGVNYSQKMTAAITIIRSAKYLHTLCFCSFNCTPTTLSAVRSNYLFLQE